MNVRDSRVHNYPPRWNGAPSQDLLVIRRNNQTGELSLDPLRWGLIPYWYQDPSVTESEKMRRAAIGKHLIL
jgi:putative SOS response-associated peptidase YedK